jgi:hypothetical protein
LGRSQEVKMNLVPEFKIELLNAWLGAIPILVAGLIFMVANKKAGKRAIDISWYTTKEKIMAWPCMLGYYGAILYSITVPLKLGTIWFYSDDSSNYRLLQLCCCPIRCSNCKGCL